MSVQIRKYGGHQEVGYYILTQYFLLFLSIERQTDYLTVPESGNLTNSTILVHLENPNCPSVLAKRNNGNASKKIAALCSFLFDETIWIQIFLAM